MTNTTAVRDLRKTMSLEECMRDKWRCSKCGRVNSMQYDNCCPRCMEKALREDQEKLDQLTRDLNLSATTERDRK